jgi:hypothetical protein
MGGLALGGDLLMVTEIVGASVVFADFQSGAVLGSQCLSELVPEECSGEPGRTCMLFEVKFDATEGAGVQLNYTHRNPEVKGQPSRLIGVSMGPESEVSYGLDRLSFSSYLPDLYEGVCLEEGVDDVRCLLNMAHASVSSPDGSFLAFADTRSARIVFGEPDFSTGILEVRAVLDSTHPDWENLAWVNHVALFEEAGRLFMLNSFKGGGAVVETQRNAGRIVLWDVTDLNAISKVWAYPSVGHLAAPHKATRLQVEGRDVLMYAHSLGAADTFDGPQSGSVGLATFSVSTPPVYLGDWVLGSDDGHIGFLRDAELLSDGETLLMTDSGCESLNSDCHDPEKVFTVAFPALPEPPGLPGSFSTSHSAQVFFELRLLRADLIPNIRFPYEADVIPFSALAPLLNGDEFRPCSP